MLVSLGFIVDFAKSCLPPSPVSQRVRVSDCLFFSPLHLLFWMATKWVGLSAGWSLWAGPAQEGSQRGAGWSVELQITRL